MRLLLAGPAHPGLAAALDALHGGAEGPVATRIRKLLRWGGTPREGRDPISLESLTRAVDFVRKCQKARDPDVFLAPTGFVQLEWYASADSQVVVQFPPHGHVSFLIRGERGRYSGIASEECVRALIDTSGAAAMAREAGVEVREVGT